MAGVTAASEAESARASSIDLRFEDRVKSIPMPIKPIAGTSTSANIVLRLPSRSRRKRCSARRFMVHLYASLEFLKRHRRMGEVDNLYSYSMNFLTTRKENS